MDKVAVWIDQSGARMITFENGSPKTENIDSGIEGQQRIEGEGKNASQFGEGNFTNNEHTENNRKANEINSYLKTVSNKISGFQHIVLFGPGNVKDQLKNHLDGIKAFDGKKIEVHTSDKLTDNQLVAFAREHLAQ